MTKTEFVECLRAKGFDVLLDDGCVLIVTENKADLDKLDELATETGFIGNRGWRDANYGNIQATD